ncbi:MAG: hypothetical protein M0R22_09425 [Dehalococcoidia bacterium]|nr:hypothetical protein [Dehalococcoidia bacterium]
MAGSVVVAPPERLTLTVMAACRLAGVSRNHMYSWLARNPEYTVRFGRRLLVRRFLFEEYVNGRPEAQS